MNILVTGGTGLIGRHFILTYQDEYQFTVLTRNNNVETIDLPKNCRFIHNLDALSDLNDFDAVINLAGEPIVDKRWTAAQKKVIERSRLGTTEQLVQLFHRSNNPPEVFISGSAIGFYGAQSDVEINEKFTDIHPEFAHHLCAQWEAAAMQAKTAATRVCILRTGIVLAADGGALSKMLLPFKLGAGGPIASGKQYMSWIHIADMVSAINHLLLRANSQGIYNLTAPVPQTNAAFVKMLGAVLTRPAILPMPECILRLIMGESADLLVKGQRVVPDALLEEGFSFVYADLEQALSSLLKAK